MFHEIFLMMAIRESWAKKDNIAPLKSNFPALFDCFDFFGLTNKSMNLVMLTSGVHIIPSLSLIFESLIHISDED
jgi:hypothetical protein